MATEEALDVRLGRGISYMTKALFFSWVNPHLPTSTHFNLLQPISTHLKKKYQLQPDSTYFNQLQPTSTHPLHNFNNL